MTPLDPREVPRFAAHGGLVLAGLVTALVGALVLALGLWLAPERTLAGYLSVFTSLLALGLGALVLLMIVHAMNAKWPVPIRRLIEAPVMAMPALAIAFAPILVFADRIYAWMDPAALPQSAREVVEAKAGYLQLGPFALRAIVVWAVWLVVGELLLRWSRQQDDRDHPALRRYQRRLSAGALPAVALALTLAAFDWIMSLEPTWYSTMFGLDLFASGFVAAIALVTLLVVFADRGGLLASFVGPSHYYALGRLLLAFVVFWAYIEFFQVFLIWIANRPEEVEWYLHRLEHGWQVVAVVIAFGHFVVPFLVLLSYRIKRWPGGLAAIAGLVVLAHLLDMHWKVVPARAGASTLHFGDLGAIALLGGLCVACVAWRLRGRCVAPRFDRALAKGTRYHSE